MGMMSSSTGGSSATTAKNTTTNAVGGSSNGNTAGNDSNNNSPSNNDNNRRSNPTSSDLLATVLSSGGRGAPRAIGEATGKKLLVGEVRLDRHTSPGDSGGWLYKVSVNGQRLPPKAVPKWTVWLEVPAGDTITLEASTEDGGRWGGLVLLVIWLIHFVIKNDYVRIWKHEKNA